MRGKFSGRCSASRSDSAVPYCFYYEGLSQKEVAQVLGLGLRAAGLDSRARRALERPWRKSMQEPHETPEARKRLEVGLDRCAVTPRADLERLLSNLPSQEASRGLAPWAGWAPSYPRNLTPHLWRPAALAALPVL